VFGVSVAQLLYERRVADVTAAVCRDAGAYRIPAAGPVRHAVIHHAWEEVAGRCDVQTNCSCEKSIPALLLWL
jgi:hypothetical protein